MVIVAAIKRNGPPGERMEGDGDDMQHISITSHPSKDGYQDLNVDLRQLEDFNPCTADFEYEDVKAKFEDLENIDFSEGASEIIKVDINQDTTAYEDLENIDFSLAASTITAADDIEKDDQNSKYQDLKDLDFGCSGDDTISIVDDNNDLSNIEDIDFTLATPDKVLSD